MREAQERLDAQEFAEWQAYYKICPWGDDWAQADLIAWVLYQANRGRDSRDLEPGAFMPRAYGIGITAKPESAKSPEEVVAKLNQWAKVNGVKSGS